MDNITRSCLAQCRYSPKDFKVGERLRVYITYWGFCTEIDVREGVVLDPDYPKKSYFWGSPESSLRLKVENSGRVVDRKPKLRKVSYIRSYIYPNIGLVERLSGPDGI